MDIDDIIHLEEWSDEKQFRVQKKMQDNCNQNQNLEVKQDHWQVHDPESYNQKYKQDLTNSQIDLNSILQNSIISCKNDEDTEAAPIIKMKHFSRPIGPDGIVDMRTYLEHQKQQTEKTHIKNNSQNSEVQFEKQVSKNNSVNKQKLDKSQFNESKSKSTEVDEASMNKQQSIMTQKPRLMIYDSNSPRNDIMKKVVFKTSEGDMIDVLKLDQKKLDGILGEELSDSNMVKLKLEIERDQAIQRGASANDIREIEELQNVSANYKIEIKQRVLLNKEKQLVNHDEKSIQNFGSALQMRLLEKWINDVMEQCEEDGHISGILVAPEQSHPMDRYGIGRVDLQNRGIDNKVIDRIYRALYVHSVGLFNLLKELLIHNKEGRQALLSDIWRVFQILLEYACQAEYKMITQKLIENHEIQLTALNETIESLSNQLIKKDQDLQGKLAKISQEYEVLQKERQDFENERMKMRSDFKKLGTRFEEEVELRLYFESKLNSLHCVNKESESELKIIAELKLKLDKQNEQLRKDNHQLIIQNIDYKDYKEKLQDKVWSLQEKQILISEKLKEFTISDVKLRESVKLKTKVNEIITIKLESKTKELIEVKQDLNDEKLKVTRHEQKFDHIQLFYDEAKKLNEIYENKMVEMKNKIIEKEKLLTELQIQVDQSERDGVQNKTRLDQALITIIQITKDQEDWEQKYKTKEFQVHQQIKNISQLTTQKEEQFIVIQQLSALKEEANQELKRQIIGNQDLQKQIQEVEENNQTIKQENIQFNLRYNRMKEEYAKMEVEIHTNSLKFNQIEESKNDGRRITQQRLLNAQAVARAQRDLATGHYGQKCTLQDFVKKIQIENLDFEFKCKSLVMNNDTQMNVINEFQTKNKKLVDDFQNFMLEAEHNDENSITLNSKVDWLNERNNKEVDIYKEKIVKLNQKIQRMRMPIEDLSSQVLRLQEKNIEQVRQNQKLEEQMRFLGKRYTASLISRFLQDKRLGKVLRERLNMEQEKKKLISFQILHEKEITLMNNIKNKLEEKYKSAGQIDPEKKQMTIEEQFVELIKENQIMSNQVVKIKQEVKTLNSALQHLRDTYQNKIFYEKSTQTFVGDYYDSFFKTAMTQTKKIQKRLIKKGESVNDSVTLISSNQSLKRKTEIIRRQTTQVPQSDLQNKLQGYRHTMVSNEQNDKLLPTINSRHSSENMQNEKSNNLSNSFDKTKELSSRSKNKLSNHESDKIQQKKVKISISEVSKQKRKSQKSKNKNGIIQSLLQTKSPPLSAKTKEKPIDFENPVQTMSPKTTYISQINVSIQKNQNRHNRSSECQPVHEQSKEESLQEEENDESSLINIITDDAASKSRDKKQEIFFKTENNFVEESSETSLQQTKEIIDAQCQKSDFDEEEESRESEEEIIELDDEMALGYIEMLKPLDCVALIDKINRLPVVKGSIANCFKCKTKLRNNTSNNIHYRLKTSELQKEIGSDIARYKSNQQFKTQLKRIIQKTSTPQQNSTEQSSRISNQQQLLIKQMNMKRSQSSEGALGNRKMNQKLGSAERQNFLTNVPLSLKSITSANQTGRGYNNINQLIQQFKSEFPDANKVNSSYLNAKFSPDIIRSNNNNSIQNLLQQTNFTKRLEDTHSALNFENKSRNQQRAQTNYAQSRSKILIQGGNFSDFQDQNSSSFGTMSMQGVQQMNASGFQKDYTKSMKSLIQQNKNLSLTQQSIPILSRNERMSTGKTDNSAFASNLMILRSSNNQMQNHLIKQ